MGRMGLELVRLMMRTTEEQLENLYSTISDRKNILVLTHNDPDPDALGAAFGIAALLKLRVTEDQHFDLAFGGILGRVENREMVRVLDLTFLPVEQVVVDEYDSIILVDCQPGAGNHGLPESRLPEVVIDHHPLLEQTKEVPYYDVRPDIGATATIVAEYLSIAGVTWEQRLATALFYGIKTDTLGLARGATEEDAHIYLALYQHVDRALIAQIERAPLPRRYFQELAQALNRAVVYENVIIVNLGDIHRSDLVAEIADFFLRLDGVQWSIVFGVHEGVLSVSIRSSGPELKAGRLIREAVGHRGTAGGHVTMAAGRIPIEEGEVETMSEQLKQRFLQLLDLEHVQGQLLLNSRE